ncbi:hypothetical protein NKH98_11790 [Mesorhizobium sp. M0833]
MLDIQFSYLLSLLNIFSRKALRIRDGPARPPWRREGCRGKMNHGGAFGN